MQQAHFDFESPREIGEQQAQACAAAAEKRGWDLPGARDFVLRFLQQGAATGEAIVNAAKKAGFTPHDDRAFGAVFGPLSKAGRIECIGTGMRKKGHGTAGARIWELRVS